MRTIEDKGLILAHLITGAELTVLNFHRTNTFRNAWAETAHLNRHGKDPIEIPADFAVNLILSGCVQQDSGNFETGEDHFFFRVRTQKNDKGDWRLEVTRDSGVEAVRKFKDSKQLQEA